MLKQIPLDLTSHPALGRDDFFVSSSNEMAVHWVEKWPLGWAPFPALTLYGAKGSGKSHLAEMWRGKAKASLLTPDDFMALTRDDILEQTGSIALDRIDLLVGDRDQEEKLFHLYNHCLTNNMYVLATSRLAPAHMVFELRDLASRLRAAPSAEILSPDDDLLAKVIAKRFHDQGYNVAENVIAFVVARIERSWESVDALIGAAIQKATSEKKQITLPLLRDLMIALD